MNFFSFHYHHFFLMINFLVVWHVRIMIWFDVFFWFLVNKNLQDILFLIIKIRCLKMSNKKNDECFEKFCCPPRNNHEKTRNLSIYSIKNKKNVPEFHEYYQVRITIICIISLSCHKILFCHQMFIIIKFCWFCFFYSVWNTNFFVVRMIEWITWCSINNNQ